METTSEDNLIAIRQHIEATNEAFKAASREEKRVMLAKDILLQLGLKRIRPTSAYLGVSTIYMNREFMAEHELQEVLKNEPLCKVCGIGALFLTAIERLDKFKVKDFFGADDPQLAIHRYLAVTDLFTTNELYWIERFFENAGNSYKWSLTNGIIRMQHLAETIINTKGAEIVELTFKVDPTPAQLDASQDWYREEYRVGYNEVNR